MVTSVKERFGTQKKFEDEDLEAVLHENHRQRNYELLKQDQQVAEVTFLLGTAAGAAEKKRFFSLALGDKNGYTVM